MTVQQRVSECTAGWIEEALGQHLQPAEDCWYDVTLAPTGGGPSATEPFLACVLSMRGPILNTTLSLSQFFNNYIVLTKEEVNTWVEESLEELRTAASNALKPPLIAPRRNGDSPGRLFLPPADGVK